MSEAGSATERAVAALNRGVYLLDRSLAPRQKVKAFQGAIRAVTELDEDELRARCSSGTITDLAGIGPSTASVISAAVLDRPADYLVALDDRTKVPAGAGGDLRAMIRGDCHLHTNWSDGGAELVDMIAAAAALGHEYVVVTDHSARLTIAHGLDRARLEAQMSMIDGLRETSPIDILCGMEVDILEDGALDLDDDLLERLDLVVASVHSKLAQPSDLMTYRMMRAVTHPMVNVLGHCTGRQVLGSRRSPSQFDAAAVFAQAAASDTAVEINCRPERQDPPEELVAIALEAGCLFSIDTDAHAPGQLEWQPFGCDKAVRCGIPAERIINTWPSGELTRWTRGR